MRGLKKVRGEFSLSTLAYNLRRVLNIVGVKKLLEFLHSRQRAPDTPSAASKVAVSAAFSL
ncbi:MAG: hypothetical protein M3347_02170 [Armatimonadota bacterium]|nr:hypothetical protein [Armatimonadota bacterium]